LTAKYWLAVIRTETVAGETEAGIAEWRANMDLHLRALDKLARINGWIVERKQVATSHAAEALFYELSVA
jgi:hypothetical protein